MEGMRGRARTSAARMGEVRVRKASLAAFGLSLALAAADASAAVLFDFEEGGGDVVGRLSGSLDLTGAVPLGPGSPSLGDPGLVPLIGGLYNGNAVGDWYLISGPTYFGPGGPAAASSSTGSLFQLNQAILSLPAGYASGAPLAGTLSFAGATLATLGITPGDYVFTLEGAAAADNAITLRFTPGAVIPLPATLPLLLGALGLGVVALRRRG